MNFARELGYVISFTGSQHIRFTRDDDTKVMIIASGTPRDEAYTKTYRSLIKSLPPAHPRRHERIRRS